MNNEQEQYERFIAEFNKAMNILNDKIEYLKIVVKKQAKVIEEQDQRIKKLESPIIRLR